LTYNPTSPNIIAAAAHGLVRHEPLRPIPTVERRRLILCTPDIEEKLQGRKPAGLFPPLATAAVLGRFIAGHAVSVSRKKRRRKRWRECIDLEQLEGFDEIWALCHRRPMPGWRLAGRFVDRDAFVIFRIYDKLEIGSDYGPVAREVQNDWTDCLGRQQSHRGTGLSDYISEPYYEMD
jgi:hypothetical protein